MKEQLLKQIRQSVSDKSWRVRFMAASHFNEVCDWLGLYAEAVLNTVNTISWQRPWDRSSFGRS